MSLNFRMTINPQHFESELLKLSEIRLINRVNAYFTRTIGLINERCVNIFASELEKDEEYAEILSGGDLAGHLGMGASDIFNLVNLKDRIASDLRMVYQPMRRNGKDGSVEFIFASLDYQSVINDSEGQYTSQPSGSVIEWLAWWMGKDVKIVGYNINFTMTITEQARSRSGVATMRKNKRGSWQMPPQYDNDESNNWISRSLIRAMSSIYEDIVFEWLEGIR